jgi:hypothetical protein
MRRFECVSRTSDCGRPTPCRRRGFGFETVRKRAYDPKVDKDHLTFTCNPETYRKNREWIKVIEEIRLWESSIVTFPANDAAMIDALRQLNALADD